MLRLVVMGYKRKLAKHKPGSEPESKSRNLLHEFCIEYLFKFLP